MAVTSKTLRLERQLRLDLEKVTDAQTRTMISAWVDAWNEVEPDLTAALLEQLVSGETVTRAQLLRSTRLSKALAVIADHLDDLTRDARDLIVGDLRAVIDAAGGAQASIIDSQLPPRAKELVDLDAWSRVDSRQLEAIVKRSTKQITSLTKPLSNQAYDAVRRELIRGAAAGSNPRETARRIIARTEGHFNGGLQRAITISSTETLDAHRAAARLGEAQHTDVLQDWTWLAELTSRTCPSCIGMHGTRHPLDEDGPNDHPRGRCARLVNTKPWSELGFPNLVEPPSLVPDAQAFFDGLPVADQKVILGPAGYDAWSSGKFPIDKWAKKQANDGWRDSYVPAKPPQSGGRVSRSAA